MIYYILKSLLLVNADLFLSGVKLTNSSNDHKPKPQIQTNSCLMIQTLLDPNQVLGPSFHISTEIMSEFPALHYIPHVPFKLCNWKQYNGFKRNCLLSTPTVVSS